jgi:hypothetical protein
MYDEWLESAHARANRSPLFKAMREKSGSDACDGCHAPMRALSGADELSAREGVTCEVCHRIFEVTPSRAGPGFRLRKAHDVKYGPLCDTNEAYFHRTECLKLFDQSLHCAGCHLWYAKTPGGGEIPVYTEYEDWQKGPHAKKQCQRCHMPGDVAPIAVAERERKNVPHHGFMGRDDLRGSGLELVAGVRGDGERVQVEATVKNVRAGHPLPAGMSGRQIVLRARATTGQAGGTEGSAEAIFERRLVDAAGKPAPFFRAERVLGDTRIAPRASRTEKLEIRAPEAGELVIELIARPIAPGLARELGLAPEETPILSTRIALGAPGARGARAGLPQRVVLKP